MNHILSPAVAGSPGPASTENLRVAGFSKLITPAQIKEQLPATPAHTGAVAAARATVRSIMNRTDERLLVVVGPCSIHDPAAALDYAKRLVPVARDLSDRLFIVMRCYFEKPRTTVGWKGLINDPKLDDSCDMALGITLARKLLLEITALGLPTATEFLDPIVPQYTADLVTWAAIGARTTESQTHREMASGLSMPVGFKNGTDGSVQTAIDAMGSSRAPHSFLGIDQDGATGIVKTRGNPDTHLVLRGGRNGPNFSPAEVTGACRALESAALRPVVMIDCSHANSGKDPNRQPDVWREILVRHKSGERAIIGAMLESNLRGGSQKVTAKPLEYGLSVTDGCIDWATTEAILREAT